MKDCALPVLLVLHFIFATATDICNHYLSRELPGANRRKLSQVTIKYITEELICSPAGQNGQTKNVKSRDSGTNNVSWIPDRFNVMVMR